MFMENLWHKEENGLQKEFIFSDFREALMFVNKVGELAEAVDHHPDIFLHTYKQVQITLFTHSANAITDKDYDLAKKIDTLV